ncbi:TPA: hypothetical protein QB290_002039 [Pasteurella multocida]|nr:hypothetical protein [Pasteurella multocida]HDR1111877.1 hypothetical protein [Pasteurella multocida]HDR1128821.1 hypothetical protein [Pasteurella multocida]HDR1133797.1 hypothetical protein [Pasteurella multocida]HDR1135050.1 hypothetical protein [Pasteurella multocida]
MTGKMKLPPRKWYSLEQAAEKITQETGEHITERDLIYYANQGFFELSVYINFKKIDDCTYNLELKNSNLNDELINEIHYAEIRSWQSYPKIEFFKGKLFTATLKDLFDEKSFFEFIKKASLDSELGLADENAIFQELDNSIPLLEDIFLNDSLIDLKTNIENLSGLFAIDFLDFEKILIDEENPIINTNDIIFKPARSENIENGFGFSITGFDLYGKSLIAINKKSIYITLEEIELLKNGGKKIRNLNSFESYIDEWRQPTRVTEPTIFKKENILFNDKTLKIFTFDTARIKPACNDEIIPQNNNVEQQKLNKGGRPQHLLKNEALKIAKATYEDYNSDITRNTLAEELAIYINDKYKESIKQRKFSTISVETIKKALSENNIGNRKGKSKNLTFTDTTKQR